MEVYARKLIPELVEQRPDIRFTAFINRETAETPGPWQELVASITVPVCAQRRAEWVRGEQQLLPGLARRARIDVLHSLASTAPAWGAFRRVVTIHDLHYRVVPDAHFGVRGLGMRILVPLAARRADRVIVISEATRHDVKRLLRVPTNRVDVVPQGVGDPPDTSLVALDQVRDRLRVGDRQVVLSVSAKRRHKNLVRLIRALARIPARRRPILVLPGYSTPHEAELRELAATIGVAADLRFLSWVTEEELEGLYALATAFVFPSLYEGFGLPVLEAMRRGVPVACSNRSSLPEVAGNAALLFDPEDERSIAVAIERILSDPVYAERLRSAGRVQAARFTWARTARSTAKTYDRAFGP